MQNCRIACVQRLSIVTLCKSQKLPLLNLPCKYLFIYSHSSPKPQSVQSIAKCHKNIPLLAEKAERRQAAAFHWQFLCTLALNLKWNINKISLDQISFESTEIILKKCFFSAENSWKCLFLISWTSLNFLGQFLVPNQSGDNSSLASLTKHVADA